MLLDVMERYWGYDRFRPLQHEAMQRVLDGGDSLVVLPTGGGKSLCYQAPALCLDGMAVVVSPLISLMKDQVDSLRSCGISAAFVNSSQSSDERLHVANEIRGGRIKLLYVSPEKLVQDRMIDFLKSVAVSTFAIDEAHCVSEWGHDFRPEYRQLHRLREEFPQTAFHAYTATATEQVRDDIVRSLELREPRVLVGSFDRPNLVYKVERRASGLQQISDLINRHRGESGIIYCTTRADVDKIHLELSHQGISSRPYHAGMTDDERRRHQEDFIEDRCDVIVATVAFGMGIDKSNVRFVGHYGMPKALENYQQESGRAGRDGLEAECCLFYSGQEMIRWKRMLSEMPSGAVREAAFQSFEAMTRFATGTACRHKALVSYFGQQLPDELSESCGACDVCLDQLDLVEEPLLIGQKILSSIFRQGQRFGGEYSALVLKGSVDQRILQNGHDRLSTYGLLKEVPQKSIRDWIEQLVSQGFLTKDGEYQQLKINEDGWRLLRGEVTPKLLKPATRTKEKRKAAVIEDSWDGVDRGLFEVLRTQRKRIADKMLVPAYIVFTDTTLRDMARQRPTAIEALHLVKGVGQKKLADFGDEFVSIIRDYCREHELTADVGSAKIATPPPEPPTQQLTALAAFRLFEAGKSIAEVAQQLSRAESTVSEYLGQFIRQAGVTDPTPWVEAELASRIEAAANECGLERLRSIFDQLGGAVSYNDIRIVVECLCVRTHFANDATL